MPSRKAVGVYDRPSPLRRRQIWVPLAVGAVAMAGWVLFFLIW